MFREQQVEGESEAWGDEAAGGAANERPTPKQIDRALRRIAQRRSVLDVEEARWLRLGEEQNAWRALGYAHALEYLEGVFGYAPRTATERLRVATELEELPELESALEAGELCWSVVRELTRVATPRNVDRWLAAARGKNLRQVEQMVSGHRKGDDPDDAPDPKLVKYRLCLDLDAESFALFRRARAALSDEAGETLGDKAVILEMARLVLGADNGESGKKRPARTIHIMTCRQCKRGWHDGAGALVELPRSAIELAECDAVVVDDETGKRVRTAIPVALRRFVVARDQFKCTVPGCRSARNLDAHHLKAVALGGKHSAPNLTTLCGGHHKCFHEGTLVILGQAPDRLVFIRDGIRLSNDDTLLPASAARDVLEALDAGAEIVVETKPRAGSSRRVSPPNHQLDAKKKTWVEGVTMSDVQDARAALVQLGFKRAEAERAVEIACAHVGADPDLPALIKEALRHCP